MFPQRGSSGDVWLTPPHITTQLGPFDLDPCAPLQNPHWIGADKHFTEQHDGLLQPWEGRVWLNPPYGRGIEKWLEKMALHVEAGGSGIALIFARTDTAAWQEHVFPVADSIYWIRGRLKFYRPDGTPGDHPAGAPSALIAYTYKDTDYLHGIRGKIPGAMTINAYEK